MNPRIKEPIVLALAALLVVVVVVSLILITFRISGHEALLEKLLQSTAEGNVYGVAFTAGGPFGMWVIALLLLLWSRVGAQVGQIRLNLCFANEEIAPPSGPTEFDEVKCSYLLSSGGKKMKEKEATVLMERMPKGVFVPYIYVKVPRVENPEFQVILQYAGHTWRSDSYSPTKGSVDLL